MKTTIRNEKVNHLNTLVSAQIRAARALLRWSAEDLARASAVGLTTIRRAELTDQQTSLTAANDLAIRRALEAAGVEFIVENGGGPGVRLRDRRAATSGGSENGSGIRLLKLSSNTGDNYCTSATRTRL
jgi:transcriptional regulator with XRE-family HTH domain